MCANWGVAEFLQAASKVAICMKRANQASLLKPVEEECVDCVCRLIRGTASVCVCVCVYECADIWQSWTCSYTGCEWPEGSRPTREWARQLARPLLPSQLSLVVWPCGWDSASCVQTLEKTLNLMCSNPICWIKIKHFNVCLKGFTRRTPHLLLFCPLQSLWMLGMSPELRI